MFGFVEAAIDGVRVPDVASQGVGHRFLRNAWSWSGEIILL